MHPLAPPLQWSLAVQGLLSLQETLAQSSSTQSILPSPSSSVPLPQISVLTSMVMEQSCCTPQGSAMLKVMVCWPRSGACGVHEKVLFTGLPLVGSAGDSEDPLGAPATLRVTASLPFGSDAWIGKVSSVFG